MANAIKELKGMIVRSIAITPSRSFDDLMSRDFLKNRSRTGVEFMVYDLERTGHLYYRGDTLYAYKQSTFIGDE